MLLEICQFQNKWLNGVIQEGQEKKVFRNDLTSNQLGELIMSMAIGSQSMARVSENPAIIREIKLQALEILKLK
jgi:hypothetical protein